MNEIKICSLFAGKLSAFQEAHEGLKTDNPPCISRAVFFIRKDGGQEDAHL